MISDDRPPEEWVFVPLGRNVRFEEYDNRTLGFFRGPLYYRIMIRDDIASFLDDPATDLMMKIEAWAKESGSAITMLAQAKDAVVVGFDSDVAFTHFRLRF